ncbi:uncharacterized protein [Channa argus]|uniref:uncharacterized protein isoform X3 n=1 Tax=Channa argus TaxID=215402 RepID=UPI00351FA7AF
MTNLMDDLLCPLPHTGHRLHTQESGDDGLSSNMEHKFSENYSQNDFPIADKGSFVRPIPEEQDKMTRPIVYVTQNSKINSSVPHSQSESLLKPPNLAGAKKKPFPPQATPVAQSDKGLEEATDNTLLRTTTITEEQPHAEMAEDGGIVNISTAESKGSSLVVERIRRSNGPRKRVYFLCLAAIAITVPVSEGISVRSFACKDKDTCPKLMTIYGPNDTRLYHRDLDETFPECSGVSPPTPQSCVACTSQADIVIICPKDIGKLEGETNDGRHITNITSHDEQQQLNGRASFHLGISNGLFLMVVLGAPAIKWIVLL